MKVEKEVKAVVELYFQGYPVKQAVSIVNGGIEKEVLEKILENYERRVKNV